MIEDSHENYCPYRNGNIIGLKYDMEDFLTFRETQKNHWHAEYDDIKFDIDKRESGYELSIAGNEVHQTINCTSLEEAEAKAMKYLVW